MSPWPDGIIRSECLPGLSNSQIRRAFDFSPARQDYLEWGILNAHKLIDIIAEEVSCLIERDFVKSSTR